MSAVDDCEPQVLDSPYIPVDSWIYPAVMRLFSLGYVDTVYVGMRPWTRSNLQSMLDEVSSRIEDEDLGPNGNEAEKIYESLTYELRHDTQAPCAKHVRGERLESVYTVARAISGTPLRDSYHLGSTIVNDYGRPYANGFNNYSGASGYAFAGRFLVYARGEFQGAPSTSGYSSALAATLASLDGTTDFYDPTCWQDPTSPLCTPIPYNQQATIPAGPIAAAANGRLIEAYASARYLNHEISFGKQDDWLGPGMGGGMAYSNNAENIYSFRINRTEPLHVPLLSDLVGPFRYEFLVGSLKGHTYPNDPWVHIEKISLKPDNNIEFGFERTAIWGGKGHEPITLKTFLRSFFSLSAPTAAVKNSAQDPGARFGAFDFSWRLPYVRNWLTLYSDSEVHDDVSPVDAPRHAAYRAGLYLSHVPGIAKLDVRAEGISTDPAVATCSSPKASNSISSIRSRIIGRGRCRRTRGSYGQEMPMSSPSIGPVSCRNRFGTTFSYGIWKWRSPTMPTPTTSSRTTTAGKSRISCGVSDSSTPSTTRGRPTGQLSIRDTESGMISVAGVKKQATFSTHGPSGVYSHYSSPESELWPRT